MGVKTKKTFERERLYAQLKTLLREGRKAGTAKREEAKSIFDQGRRLAVDAGLSDEAKVFAASSLLLDDDFHAAISLLLPVVERQPPIVLIGQAWDRLGLAYTVKDDYEKAIECFLKALNSPGYDTPGKALKNIGLAYCRKKDYEKAIEYYQEALNSPDYDMPGRLWYGLGNVYSEKKDYDKAIECFRKALDSPGYDTPGYAWNNMGIAYSEKQAYDKAIECYQKALGSPGYDTPGYAWHNMGNAFSRLGDIDRAIDAMQKAVAFYEGEKNAANAREAADTLEFLKKKARADRKGLSQLAQEYDDVVQALSSKPKLAGEETSPFLRRLIRRAAVQTTAFAEYARQTSSTLNDALIVLKGWSSAMPIIASVDSEIVGGRACRGGGYFVKAANHGIIIDPGYDYLRNYKSVGLHIKEANTVIVTHNHPDHQDDLTRIADLDCEYRKNIKDAPDRSRIHYYLDPDTNRAFAKNLEALNANQKLITQVDTTIPSIPIRDGFSFTPFETVHGDGVVVTRPFGLMLSVKLGDGSVLRIGYTSDTKYTADVAKALENCDILICHFSSARSEEYRDFSKLHEYHLGFNGLRMLMENTQARLYIVSEFWGGVGDQRYDLVEYLKTTLAEKGKKDFKALAGDIGLAIDLKTLGVFCQGCKRPIPYENIRTVEPSNPFDTLRYYCADCPIGMPKSS